MLPHELRMRIVDRCYLIMYFSKKKSHPSLHRVPLSYASFMALYHSYRWMDMMAPEQAHIPARTHTCTHRLHRSSPRAERCFHDACLRAHKHTHTHSESSLMTMALMFSSFPSSLWPIDNDDVDEWNNTVCSRVSINQSVAS